MELVYCLKCQGSRYSLCFSCVSLYLSLSQLTFSTPPLQTPLLLKYKPCSHRHEYEQTDVTAGWPYVTTLLDLNALIIASLGTNIDILGLNI